MKIAQLRRRHSEYDEDTLVLYSDLVAGGAQFRKNVSRYLPQHDVEPNAIYQRRCAAAHYLGYCARIVNFFASWLFTCPITITSDPPETAPFWGEFKEDVDGEGTDLDDFLRARFAEALVSRRSFVRVEFPDPRGAQPSSVSEFDALGLGRAVLVPVPARNVTHWKRDARGAWEWVLEYEKRCELLDLDAAAETVTETWTQWRADGTARRWQIEYPAERGKGPTENTAVPEIDPPHNPTGGIPLIAIELPVELWVMNHLASPQLEHFRMRNANSWAIQRVCYATPVLKVAHPKKLPVLGRGYYLTLGLNDSLEYPAPPSAPFQVVEDNAAKLVEELHRVADQMASGISNNAAAVGRSGESKAADTQATSVVLTAYGSFVREFAQKLHRTVQAGRPQAERDKTWTAGGMDRYDTSDAKSVAEDALSADPLQIPSATYRREVLKKVALSQLADADESIKAKIRKEIDAGVHDEEHEPETDTPPAVNVVNVAPGAAKSAEDDPAESPRAWRSSADWATGADKTSDAE